MYFILLLPSSFCYAFFFFALVVEAAEEMSTPKKDTENKIGPLILLPASYVKAKNDP